MKTKPEPEPKVDVCETPDGVLDVVIQTVDDDELKELRKSTRRAPKRVH